MTRAAAEAVFAHWAREPLPAGTGDVAATIDNDTENQAEQLAVEDAFAEVEAEAIPAAGDENGQEATLEGAGENEQEI